MQMRGKEEVVNVGQSRKLGTADRALLKSFLPMVVRVEGATHRVTTCRRKLRQSMPSADRSVRCVHCTSLTQGASARPDHTMLTPME